MSDKILIEYQDNLNVLIKEHKDYQNELKNSEAAGVKAADNIAKSTDKATNSTKSLKTQLRELKEQIAQTAPGSKEFDKLTAAAGRLKDQINDTNESINVLASGSKLEQISNTFGSIVTNVRNLDFARASEQAKVLLTIARSLTFAEAISGVKALITTVIDLGKAVLLNPFTAFAAAIAGVVYVVYDLIGAFSDFNTQSKTLNESLKASEERITKLGDKQAEYLIKLATAQGKLTKAQGEAKLSELKNFQERTDLAKKFGEDVKKLAEELGISLSDLQKNGKFSEVYTLDYKDLLARKKFNAEFLQLQRQFRQEQSLLLKTQITEGQTRAQETLNRAIELQKQNNDKIKELNQQHAEDLANQDKVLRDLRTENINNDFEKEKEKLKNKLADDLKLYKDNAAILIELKIAYYKALERLQQDHNQKEYADDHKLDAEKIKASQDRINAIQKQEDDFEEATRQRNLRMLEEGVESMKIEVAERQKLMDEITNSVSSGLSSLSQIAKNISDRQIEDIEQRKDFELSSLEDQYKNQLITKEQYERERTAIEETARKEESRIKREQFERDKQIALIQVAINTAQAVSKAYAAGGPFALGLAALMAVLGAAQAAAIVSQPTPKFAKGGKVGGKLHSQGGEIIEAERDEWIIKRDQALKNDRLLKAVNDGEGDSFIRVHYIAPALKEQQKKFQQAISGSINQDIRFKDENLLDSLKASRRAEKENTVAIIKAVKSIGSRSSHKW